MRGGKRAVLQNPRLNLSSSHLRCVEPCASPPTPGSEWRTKLRERAELKGLLCVPPVPELPAYPGSNFLKRRLLRERRKPPSQPWKASREVKEQCDGKRAIGPFSCRGSAASLPICRRTASLPILPPAQEQKLCRPEGHANFLIWRKGYLLQKDQSPRLLQQESAGQV